MGGLRIEHRLRCTVEQLYDEAFMTSVLPFLSVRGMNTYLQQEHRGVHVPWLLVRVVPRAVVFWQASHFVLLLRARMAAATKASLTTPVDRFLFSWLAQCCGLVTVRWQSDLCTLLRRHPELWDYINGVRVQLKFSMTSFQDCAALRCMPGAARIGARGFMELHDSGEGFDADGDAGAGDDACSDGGDGMHDLLQTATRVRSDLFRNGASQLPNPNDAVPMRVDFVDVTDCLADAHIARQFIDFEENVCWAVRTRPGAFGHHALRGLRSVYGYVCAS